MSNAAPSCNRLVGSAKIRAFGNDSRRAGEVEDVEGGPEARDAVEDLDRLLRASVRVAPQQVVDQLHHCRREVRTQLSNRRSCLGELALDDGETVRPGERRPAGEQREQHATQRVEIRPLVAAFGAELLGSAVLRGARGRELRRAGDRHRGLHEAGDAEVDHLHPVVRGEHHVQRLDVVVDHVSLVRGDQRGTDLLRDLQGAAGCQRTVRAQMRGQRRPFDPLHHQVEVVLVEAAVVQGDHVRVVDLRGGDGFAVEALGDVGGDGVVQGQELDGHVPAELAIPAGPDLTHPAPAELRDQLVTPSDQVPTMHTSPYRSSGPAFTCRGCRRTIGSGRKGRASCGRQMGGMCGCGSGC